MAKKSLSIKLNKVSDGKYERDSWYGIGPFKTTLNDDGSLGVVIPGQDTQICTPSENDYGTFWTLSLGGGKAFASVVDHDQYGHYMRIKLGNEVKLPDSVMEKINYRPGGAKKTAPKKSGGNAVWA